MTDEPTGLPPQFPPAAAPPPVAQPPVAPAPPPVAAPAYVPPAQAPMYAAGSAAGRPGPMPGVYYSGHPARLIAWLIDGFILSIVATAVYFVIVLVGALLAQVSEGLGGLVIAVGFLVIGILGLAWYPWWWSKSGQSPGKKLMHIKVVREDNGQLLSFGGGFVRLFGYWVAAFVFYIGFLWILFDDKRQGWADKIANTVVIEVP